MGSNTNRKPLSGQDFIEQAFIDAQERRSACSALAASFITLV
jgi:hypothetical protein